MFSRYPHASAIRSALSSAGVAPSTMRVIVDCGTPTVLAIRYCVMPRFSAALIAARSWSAAALFFLGMVVIPQGVVRCYRLARFGVNTPLLLDRSCGLRVAGVSVAPSVQPTQHNGYLRVSGGRELYAAFDPRQPPGDAVAPPQHDRLAVRAGVGVAVRLVLSSKPSRQRRKSAATSFRITANGLASRTSIPPLLTARFGLMSIIGKRPPPWSV